MAVIIDGKVYRNLEEQVLKNKEDIIELKGEPEGTLYERVIALEEKATIFENRHLYLHKGIISDFETKTILSFTIFSTSNTKMTADSFLEYLAETDAPISASGCTSYDNVMVIVSQIYRVGERLIAYEGYDINGEDQSSTYLPEITDGNTRFNDPIQIY